MASYDVSHLLAQAECYKILALLFNKPETGVQDNRKLYERLVKSTTQLKPKALELAKKLRKTSSDLKAEDLLEEFSRLFGDPEMALAYPCSSVYLKNNLLNGGLMKWIEDFYARSGFIPDHKIGPPDHISSELAFIHFLLSKVSTEFKNDNLEMINHFSELRCQFIHEHMILWVPDFTRNILNSSKSPYYLQLTILVRTMLVNCTGENKEIPD